MRIACLCGTYLTHRGGAELYAHRIAGELVGMGHELTVIAAEGSLAPFPEAPYRVVALGRDRRREEFARRLLALEKVRGCYRLARWLFRSGRFQLIAAGPCCPELESPGFFSGYDVVMLVRGGGAWTVQMARAVEELRGPLTVAAPLLHVRESGAVFPILRRLYSKYDLMVALSEYESAWMREQGWGGDRIMVAGAGSDECGPVERGAFRRRHGVPVDAPLVAFVGRKIHSKGVQHVIEAMDLVWDREPKARLALLGFSHNAPEWIPGIIGSLRHPAEGRILNLDDVGEGEREQALEDCDVFCMPSVGDSFGIAYLDAWRHRKPVVACRGCSSESIVEHGRTGLLVEFGDVGGIAEAMGKLLADATIRDELGNAGRREWMDRWTWDQVARRMEQVFLDRLTAKGGAG